jgi:UDP-GlcNAc:undecaprenyl-phosphate GlcNAc-1-phosphate transferase
MTQYLPIVLASAVLAFLATPLTRWLAARLGMVDQPGLRKAHRAPTPLLGGLALYAGVTLAFVVFGQADWVTEGVGILGGATLLFITGLWDDRYGMPAGLKLAACAVAAVFLSAFGVRVQLFNVWWLDGLITVLWVVGITNAANLMDNMDGLAAGLTAVAAVFFFVLAALEGQGLVASLAAALLGSALGFLFYNLAPAVSFMGDAGSLTIGFLLAALGIKIRFLQFPLGATWMAPIVVLGVFIFDTTLVTVSRLRRGRSPFQGGSDHTSHRLAQLGLGGPRAVLTLYVAAVSLGALAITLTRLPVPAANLLFGLLAVAGLIALILFERVEPRLAGDPALVLAPGGGGAADALRAVAAVSRNVTVLLAPRRVDGVVQPGRAEVVEIIAALAEDPAAARPLLRRGLGDEWWLELPALGRALRLHGRVLAVGEVAGAEMEAEAVAALRQARLVIVGPGRADVNVRPLLDSAPVGAALRSVNGLRLWACDGPAPEAGGLQAVARAALAQEVQRRLLQQAAARAKTRA